jgi:hypothetical protein
MTVLDQQQPLCSVALAFSIFYSVLSSKLTPHPLPQLAGQAQGGVKPLLQHEANCLGMRSVSSIWRMVLSISRMLSAKELAQSAETMARNFMIASLNRYVSLKVVLNTVSRYGEYNWNWLRKQSLYTFRNVLASLILLSRFSEFYACRVLQLSVLTVIQHRFNGSFSVYPLT